MASIRLTGFAVLLAAVCFTAPGCKTPSQNDNQWSLNPAWQPYALYAAPAPHSSLYVEINAVEGMEPRKETVEALKAFLETYCDKPGGIEVCVTTVIPRSQARGYFRQELALKYIKGPPSSKDGPKPAFMYILFYDSTLEPRETPPFTTRTAAAMPSSLYWQTYNGHVEYLPYPAAAYIHGRTRGGDVDRAILLHEVGHLLGPRPGKKYHCDSRHCVMYPSLALRLRSIFLWKNRIYNTNLCDVCRASLLEARTNAAPLNLRFEGPWLTRQEIGYAVWSVPKVALIVPETPPENEIPKLLASVKQVTLSACASLKTNRESAMLTGTLRSDEQRGKTSNAIQRAAQDWYKPIRDRAKEELSR